VSKPNATREAAINRHPAKGADSVEKLLILLELTKLANDVQAVMDVNPDQPPFTRGVKQGMAIGIEYAIKTIQAMAVSE